jgi:3-deoxy-7-phosphoheptulonate synthase
MEYRTDDLRIKEIKELIAPVTPAAGDCDLAQRRRTLFIEARQAIHRILHGADDRLLVIMGPCSVHDVKAAKEYAGKLQGAKERNSPMICWW